MTFPAAPNQLTELNSAEPVALEVSDLRVEFAGRDTSTSVVRGLTYSVGSGRTLAIIGESGSGKSVGVLALASLLDSPPARVGGSVRLGGEELLGRTEAELNGVRGEEIGYVFQDATSGLNPALSVGYQIAELFRVHRRLSRRDARAEARRLLERVGLSIDRAVDDLYPHQLSGGMRQRVMIAIAIALEPRLLIADEPTTALDVTFQAEILDLLSELQSESGMAMIFITHDLQVAATIADDIAVMYTGKFVEYGSAQQIYSHPRHPYTVGLLRSQLSSHSPRTVLESIPGSPPAPSDVQSGECSFLGRCSYAIGECATLDPPETSVGEGHVARCIRATEAGIGA